MKTRRILGMIVLCGLCTLLIILLFPRSYEVNSFQERSGTLYWNLSSGSHIGYTKIESNTVTDKNPIIYLHGGPGGRIKDKVIEVLSPISKLGHDIYFYDQVGSGHSERLEDIKEYTVKRHQEDLHQIINTIGSEKVIFIAHSWGALLAINYLQDHEASVEQIILSGPGPILPINKGLANKLPPDDLALRSPEYSNKEGNQKAHNWRSKFVQKCAFLFGIKLASDKEADDFFTHLNQQLSRSTECELSEIKKYEGGAGYYNHVRTVKSFYQVENKRAYLKTLKTPMLIIRGQCDNQKWGFAKEYLDLFSNAQLEVIKNSGHDLISGDREKYYDLISTFLEADETKL